MQSVMEIQQRVMSLQDGDVRSELVDALNLIGQLEADFAIVCKQISQNACDNVLAPGTSAEFDQMCNRRGIEIG